MARPSLGRLQHAGVRVHTLRIARCIKQGIRKMFKASAGKTLPTSIIGSLPRPSWYTAVLGAKTFLEAMVNARYREQYEDVVSLLQRRSRGGQIRSASPQ